MARAAAALGLTSLSSHVTMTSITATARRGEHAWTQLAERRHVSTNARLLCALVSTGVYIAILSGAGAAGFVVPSMYEAGIISSILYSIPGVPLYRGLVALNEGDFLSTLATFSQIGCVILAIGLGLALTRVMLDRGWRHDADTVELMGHLPLGEAV